MMHVWTVGFSSDEVKENLKHYTSVNIMEYSFFQKYFDDVARNDTMLIPDKMIICVKDISDEDFNTILDLLEEHDNKISDCEIRFVKKLNRSM